MCKKTAWNFLYLLLAPLPVLRVCMILIKSFLVSNDVSFQITETDSNLFYRTHKKKIYVSF